VWRTDDKCGRGGSQTRPFSLARYQLLLALLALIALFFYGRIDHTVEPYSTWDLHSYLTMAEAAPGLAVGVHQPFCYRLLGPYVVGLLPLPEPTGFYLLTALAAVALAVVFPVLLTGLGLSPGYAALSTALFLLNRNVLGYSLWNCFQVSDTLSLLFLALLLLALWRRRWVAFGGALLLGALTRETSLLMAPVALAYLWERGALRQDGVRLLLAALPGVTCFLALRGLIVPAGGRGLWEAFLFYSGKLADPETWFRLFVNPYLPLIFLPLIWPKRTLAFFREQKHLLVLLALVYVSALFGQNNERLVAPAYVAFYALIGWIAQRELAGRRGVVVVLLAGAAAASLHHTTARFPLPDRMLTLALSMGSLAAVTLCGLIARAAVRRG